MHSMHPPQRGNRVKHHVLQVDSEVECHHRYQQCSPGTDRQIVEQTPATLFSQERHTNRPARQQDSEESGVQRDDREVAWPTLDPRIRSRAARRDRFPQHHCREDRDDRGESNNGFVYNRH